MGMYTDGNAQIEKRAVSVTQGNQSVSYDAEYFISSKILGHAEMRSGHRCYILHKPLNLLIWIFASNVLFVNNVVTQPSKGLKLLYRYAEDSKVSNSASSIEVLNIDDYEHDEVIHLLECSTRHLPRSLRKFGDFNVGYLRCF